LCPVSFQCKSPLRGLRTADRCCRGNGIGWGVTDCTRCPTPRGDECPLGFTRGSDGQCQDTNECRMSGICQNGKCVNTRGGHTCICDPGFVSDTAKTQCICEC
uniref:EGF-like domain-containing protein n=1 Tax=Callorhinchus milii TaxID=7868 RepID=A0A4W3HGF4_CALMI